MCNIKIRSQDEHFVAGTVIAQNMFFLGQGNDFDFHRVCIFLHYRRKRQQCRFDGWNRKKGREREKSYFSSKMSKVLTTIKLTDIWR